MSQGQRLFAACGAGMLAAVAAAAALPAADRMSMRDCITTALRQQPSMREAAASIDSGSGKEIQARSPYFPQASVSTGYSENKSIGGAFGDSTTKSYSTTLSVSQLLYDFGRTGNSLDASKWGVRSAEWNAGRVRQEVVLNVQQAYYGLLQAQHLEEVAEKTVQQTEDHLRRAEAFFRSGAKPRYEVTRAEVDLNSARLGLINARNTVRIRTISLNNSMGIEPGAETAIEDVQPPDTGSISVKTLEEAKAEALKQKPELLKAQADCEAAEATVRSEEANWYPTLSANGGYTWANGTATMGPFQGDVSNSWNAGVTLTLPLFQGGLTRGKVGEARAALRILEAQRDSVRQAVLLEVTQAVADLESARLRIEVMESSLKKARESLDLANGRYEAGVGPSLDVTDARVAEINAEADRLQAIYDYYLAAARLDKATGKPLQE